MHTFGEGSWLGTLLKEPRWQLFIFFCILLTLSFLLFGLTYLGLPHLRRALILEDGFTENLSVFLYFEAALICTVFSIRDKFLAEPSTRQMPKGYALIGIASLIFVLEEISYGQRLFPSLRFPELANGATFDALSDLNRVMTISLDRIGVPWELVVLVVIGLLGFIFRRRAWSLLKQACRVDSLWLYVVVAALCLVGATTIDTYINPPARFVFIEEVLELNAGLSMVFAALAGPLLRRQS